MDNFSVDAFKPKEIAARIDQLAISKSSTDPLRIFMLSLLAGAFIAFGATFYTLVIHQPGLNIGISRLIGGLVFSLGLILVIIAGAELFTGNNLLVMAYVDKKITLKQLLTNWCIVFIGNFIGSIGIAALIYLSDHWLINGGAVRTKAIFIANSKVNLAFIPALVSGILCNALVCLAVWLCFAGHTVTDKILAIIFPISAFVALGFEHSIANMYFIPAAMLAQTQPEVMQALGNVDISHLNFSGLINNLIPVTLGNILGGSFFVGLVYWFIYLRD